VVTLASLVWLVSCGRPEDSGRTDDTVPQDSSPSSVPPEHVSGAVAETASPIETGETPIPDAVVDCGGDGDFLTVQGAIEGSVSGSRIGLAPCTYREDIDLLGKSLDIFGIDGPSTTVLQGTGTTSVVTAARGEGLGTRLAGVTVTGGRADYGSAVRADTSFLALDDVVFSGNDGGYAVLYATGSFLELTDVRFTDNDVPSGGMVVVDNGTLLAERTTVECANGEYGIYQHNSMLLLDSTVDCGRSYGIVVSGGELHARRSTVKSDGMAVYGEDNPDTRNERMWLFNSAFVGGETAVSARYMHVKADNDVFWGDRVGLDLDHAHIESYVRGSVGRGGECGFRADGGVLFEWDAVAAEDPQCDAEGFGTVVGAFGFVSAPDDWHLLPTSALVDAGDPDADREDADGTRNDIGVYGGPGGSW
jgi:hypothetical protein